MSAEADELLDRFAELARNCKHLRSGMVDDIPRRGVNFACLDCGQVHATVTEEALTGGAWGMWIEMCAERYHELIQAATAQP